jgi:hypothetical protein
VARKKLFRRIKPKDWELKEAEIIRETLTGEWLDDESREFSDWVKENYPESNLPESIRKKEKKDEKDEKNKT